MLTTLYPMVQFKKNTWEIDEFDCASLYLLIGTEKAMLIDCGMGIGDLRTAVERMTDKPLYVVISHGHVDHTGNARQFKEIWINPKDKGAPIPQSLEKRKYDVRRIAKRQKGSIGGAYSMFRLYPYDIDVDLRDEAELPMPVIHDMYDGEQFDLGGGRIVTAYDCPGHSKGEMVFLDEQTRSLFCGDALNYNLGAMDMPAEATLKYLKRIDAMKDRYDGIYNGHHDFRAMGVPLGEDCMANVIAMLEDVLAGHIVNVEDPNFWGADMPLSASPDNSQPVFPDPMKDAVPKKKIRLRRGRNYLGIDANNIFCKDEDK